MLLEAGKNQLDTELRLSLDVRETSTKTLPDLTMSCRPLLAFPLESPSTPAPGARLSNLACHPLFLPYFYAALACPCI